MRTHKLLFLVLFLPTLVFASSQRVARNLPFNSNRVVQQGPARDDPGRDRIEIISYENQDGLGNFLVMPDWTGFGDHSYNVRFTPEEAEFSLIGLEVGLYDLEGNNGNPGMEVSIWSSDNDGFPNEELASFNVANNDLEFSSVDEIVWNHIIFGDHGQDDIPFENADNFHIVLNVIQEEDSDTLAILLDDGERQPTDRSGLYNGEWEVWDLIEIVYDVGYNLAIHAIVEYPDPDPPVIIVAPREIETDMRVGELGEFVLNLINVGRGVLEWESVFQFVEQPGNPPDQPWMNWEPSEGEMDPDMDIDVILTLLAVGLVEGEYVAELHILSNDPESPDVAVSIFMDVESGMEQAPQIGVNPEAIDFGLVDEQDIDPIRLEIFNGGNLDLFIDAINVNGDFFTDFEQEFSIEPFDSAVINVGFAPRNAGVSDGDLIIRSNDPNQSDLTVPLRGEIPLPPQIGLDPLQIWANGPAEFNIEISNTGGRDLDWMAECEAQWCDISPVEGTVLPDDSGNMVLTVDTVGISGHILQTQIVFVSNDPEGTGIAIDVYYDDQGFGVHESNIVPATFSLNSIYPNPFNPSTTIRYSLPSAQLVNLMVFDANGRVVRSLITDALIQAGIHEISFDGQGLPAGNYRVKLQAGDFIQMKGMTLVK